MWNKLRQLWTVKEVRNSLLFVMAMVAIYRIAAHIPVPGVDTTQLQAFFASNQLLGFVNLFSGGSMDTFSIVALGVGPYITASIIFQLFGMIVPKLEEMQRDGSAGQQKITQYTRLAAVPLALLQAYSMIILLQQSGQGIIGDLSALQYIGIIMTMTAGTMFLMWIGELISERKVGNGISFIIFAGIIANLPTMAQQALLTYDKSQLFTYIALAVVAVLTIAVVVFITEGQRNIPVIYAKSMRGTQMAGGAETTLPLRVNMSGVVPIIFAVSMVVFPPMVAQFFINAKSAWLANGAQAVIAFFQNQTVYGILYFLLVFGFTYFYTSVVFHPERVAENIQKQGGFIPGVRPGNPTAEYLMWVINRITPAGALFLATIAVMPTVIQNFAGLSSLAIGGTSLLIVVSVVIEMMNQVNAKLTAVEYDKV